jgi:hypothetical protein
VTSCLCLQRHLSLKQNGTCLSGQQTNKCLSCTTIYGCLLAAPQHSANYLTHFACYILQHQRLTRPCCGEPWPQSLLTLVTRSFALLLERPDALCGPPNITALRSTETSEAIRPPTRRHIRRPSNLRFVCYGNREFITGFTKSPCWTMRASSIQPTS